jgi:hypothetical protein
MVFLNYERIRFSLKNLIFFFILVSCNRSGDKQDSIFIIWKHDAATGISIPVKYTSGIGKDAVQKVLTIHVSDSIKQPAILGQYTATKEAILFEPLIPFTRGLTYEVMLKGNRISEIKIPVLDGIEAPDVVGIYPTRDTLPLNLLKVYIEFSKPMREGQSLRHIRLLKNGRDSIRGAFLDLQPELWNEAGTMLTLWLDPGRIKRDLQPNKALGAPLQNNSHYALIIDSEWQDRQGGKLKKEFRKSFAVSSRDSLSPDINKWQVVTPLAGTKEAFQIDFKESLDHVLLKECFQLTDKKGNPVKGTTELLRNEAVLRFTPLALWAKSRYILKFEARLEDLAGNNLNRLFDRDITIDKNAPVKVVYTREFIVD